MEMKLNFRLGSTNYIAKDFADLSNSALNRLN